MTRKDFDEVTGDFSLPEYQQWFDQCARFSVRIGDYTMLCMKVGRKHAALRDRSLITIENPENIKWLDNDEVADIREIDHVIRVYNGFDDRSRNDVRKYMDVLLHKERIEKAASVKEGEEESVKLRDYLGDTPALKREKQNAYKNQVKCSFCGKTQDQVHRMIAGPNGAYICDDCIDICDEIMEEEDPEEWQRKRDARHKEG